MSDFVSNHAVTHLSQFYEKKAIEHFGENKETFFITVGDKSNTIQCV